MRVGDRRVDVAVDGMRRGGVHYVLSSRDDQLICEFRTTSQPTTGDCTRLRPHCPARATSQRGRATLVWRNYGMSDDGYRRPAVRLLAEKLIARTGVSM